MQSKVEWTDHTWNPWMGCDKVSEACANCYMFSDMRRYGKNPDVVARSKSTFDFPLKRSRDGTRKVKDGELVFTCSWSDFFHEDADQWRAEAWRIIRERHKVIFQIVTKRTERIADHLPPDWRDGYENVILIATTENQRWLEKRADDLLRVPAKWRGLSCEPLLGPLDLRNFLKHPSMPDHIVKPYSVPVEYIPVVGMNWVIVGGESGHTVRPTDVDWIRDIVLQCRAAHTPVFVKQLGRRLRMSFDEWNQLTEGGTYNSNYLLDNPGDKRGTLAFHDTKGKDMAEWPKDLRVRQLPDFSIE